MSSQGEQRGALRFGNNSLEKNILTSLSVMSNHCVSCSNKAHHKHSPPILSRPPKRCQTLWVLPCGEEEEVMSTPKGKRGHRWPAWLPVTPGKDGMESICLYPHSNEKKNLSPCRWGELEGAGWAGAGVRGSGWWWVPDWGTSGDFWRGRAMHHVSCYQP